MVKACNSSVGNDEEAVDSIKEAEKLHKQISAEWKDFSEVYAADMIKPFDEKMTQGECFHSEHMILIYRLERRLCGDIKMIAVDSTVIKAIKIIS